MDYYRHGKSKKKKKRCVLPKVEIVEGKVDGSVTQDQFLKLKSQIISNTHNINTQHQQTPVQQSLDIYLRIFKWIVYM